MTMPSRAYLDSRPLHWRRRITATIAQLVPFPEGQPEVVITAAVDQLGAIYNLANSLATDLRQSAESPLAATTQGRAYLGRLAAMLTRCNQSAMHLSTAINGVVSIHYLHEASATDSHHVLESRLSVLMGQAAAQRSLKQALTFVGRPLPSPQAASGASPEPTVIHQRAADNEGPARRRN
jgi:hypothetical protein